MAVNSVLTEVAEQATGLAEARVVNQVPNHAFPEIAAIDD
jgi:hypothetical protein